MHIRFASPVGRLLWIHAFVVATAIERSRPYLQRLGVPTAEAVLKVWYAWRRHEIKLEKIGMRRQRRLERKQARRQTPSLNARTPVAVERRQRGAQPHQGSPATLAAASGSSGPGNLIDLDGARHKLWFKLSQRSKTKVSPATGTAATVKVRSGAVAKANRRRKAAYFRKQREATQPAVLAA
jgi:hypothetical protein